MRWRIVYRERVASTQDLARALRGEGAGPGTVIVAQSQSRGRGRLGRSWESPPGAGLYATAILDLRGEMDRLLPLSAGLAVMDGIQASLDRVPLQGLRLKWPNDLCSEDGRKVGGILVERCLGPSPSLLLGIGLNLRRPESGFSSSLEGRAVSLEDLGIDLASHESLLLAVLEGLEKRRCQEPSSLLSDFREVSLLRAGDLLEIEPGTRRCAYVDMADDGALVATDSESRRIRVLAGEVRRVRVAHTVLSGGAVE